MKLEFEWHELKSEANFQGGVSFELAKTVFKDAFAIDTERGDRIRIISALRAMHHEQDDYFKQNA